MEIKAIIQKIIISLILTIFIVILILFVFSEPYTTKKDIIKEFYKDYKYISEIHEYLIDSEYAIINISNTDYIYDDGMYGTWYVDSGDIKNSMVSGTIPIGNDRIVELLSLLFKNKKYQNIEKENDEVAFQLWSNLDSSAGFIYAGNDNNIHSVQLLTYSEKITDNWYYFETDINKWRLNK